MGCNIQDIPSGCQAQQDWSKDVGAGVKTTSPSAPASVVHSSKKDHGAECQKVASYIFDCDPSPVRPGKMPPIGVAGPSGCFVTRIHDVSYVSNVLDL